VSLVWESEHLAPDTLALCGTLIADDLLDLVSHHPTLGEFLDSRRILYAHDSHRYPKYFDATVPRPFLPLVPTIYKEASTTRALAKLLRGWCSTVHLHDEPHRKLASEILWTGMEERTIQALTYSVFDPLVPRTTEGRGAAHAVRRAISEGYASHYMEFLGGDIPTGIRDFSYYDTLARYFPLFDIPILSALLSAVGLANACSGRHTSLVDPWSSVVAWRHTLYHKEILEIFRLLIRAADRSAQADRALATIPARRSYIGQCIRSAVDTHGTAPLVHPNELPRALQVVMNMLHRARCSWPLATHLDSILSEEGGGMDIVLVVAADVERDAVIRELGRPLNTVPVVFGKRKSFYDLGNISGTRLALVRCEQGSGRPGGSQSTVADAIDELDPLGIIVVGMAFGMDPNNQALGDVLVSSRVLCYEMQRVGSGTDSKPVIIPRGPDVPASPRLLDRLRTAAAGWSGTAHFELVLSGEKLVDNVDYRDSLQAIAPEARGGEMEGAGAFSSAYERNREWIIVKGISDWADGKKRHKKAERQGRACSAAAALVFHAIRAGSLRRP
jgi:nucleoside phosphorylase